MNFFSLKVKPISHFLLSKSKPPSTIFCISFFSTSSTPSSYPNNPSRRHNEESKNVRVSVWWDIENCAVPTGINVFKISHFIISAVRVNGIRGPIQVNAFGDVFSLSRANQEALSSTGVNLVHIPQGGKNSADRSLLVDLMYWISQNPPPAHVFLISSDRDFAGILHKLRMNNYNILLAGREGKHTPGVLCSAASIMWHWNELAKGENLSGRHFNQPPDGPYNSWYGHYRGPLEDPYEVSEESSSMEAELSSESKPSPVPLVAEQSSESKHRPVPRMILRQLRHIVNPYPEGLTFNELRCAMTRHKVPVDKDFYSYKKFSHFLQSIPHIVNVESCPDGQYYVRPVPRKVREPVEDNDTSVGLMTEKKRQDFEVTKKENGQASTITRMVDVEPQLPVSPYVKHGEKTAEDKVKKVTPVGSDNQASDAPQRDNQVAEIPVPPKDEQNSKSKVGFFKRLWYGEGADAMVTTSDIPGNLNASCSSTEMSSPKEETKSIDQHVQHSTQSSSTSFNENVKSEKIDKSEARVGLFTRVISWFKSWKYSSINTPIEQSSEEPGFSEENSKKVDDGLHSKNHELFSKDTFWNDLKSFLKTRRGSDIVLSSTSRDQIAVRLQKEGPFILQTLQESDLRYLVDLLVSKKWIAEFPTKTPRFRTVHAPVGTSPELEPQNVKPHSSNGLSSIFNGSSPQENPQSRVISAVPKKPSEKSKTEVLGDCQSLLDDLLSQNAGGFYIGFFKKHFLDKYGYPLDHQKLGYPKLVSLLQIMPGVNVESAYVYPYKVVFSPGVTDKSSGSDSDSSWKNEDESPWEELGPVTNEKKFSTLGQVKGTYEPLVSDDDEFSESEEDTTSSQGLVKADAQNRSRINEEESSLIQVLDSWYSARDQRFPGSHECSDSTESSNTSVKGEAESIRKKTPEQNCTFVSDRIQNKDKLIDGILGSLKKSGESKMQERRSHSSILR